MAARCCCSIVVGSCGLLAIGDTWSIHLYLPSHYIGHPATHHYKPRVRSCTPTSSVASVGKNRLIIAAP